MLDPTTLIAGVSAISNLFGHKSDPRQQYLAQLGRTMAEQREQQAAQDKRSIYSTAGVGGDALRRLMGRYNMGLTSAGVYGSSNRQPYNAALLSTQGAIGDLATNLQQQELQKQLSDQQYLSGLQFGAATGDLAYNRQQREQSLGGFASFLQALGQNVGGGRAVPGGDAGRTRGTAANGMQNYTPTVLPAPPGTDMNTPLAYPGNPQTLPARFLAPASTYGAYYGFGQ